MEGGHRGKGKLRHLCSRRWKKKVRTRIHRHRLRNAPRYHLPGNSPPPSPAHSLPPTVSRSPVAPVSPRPAARPSGRRVREALGRELLSGLGHFRGARRVSPPPQDDDVDAEEAAAEACCCLAHSPPLNSHPTSGRDGVKRRRRWYFRVALPEPRARPRPLPHPGGTWRTPDSLAGQRPAHLVFLLARTGRRALSGALPSGFLLLSGPEAAAYPHCDLEPGTRVPTRIIVARLPAGPELGVRPPPSLFQFPAREMARI